MKNSKGFSKQLFVHREAENSTNFLVVDEKISDIDDGVPDRTYVAEYALVQIHVLVKKQELVKVVK